MKRALLALSLCGLLAASPAFAMQGYYTQGPDQMPELAPPVSDTINDYALASNTAATITWPAGANYANLNCPSAYWASSQSGITVPSGNVTTTGAAYAPAQRKRPAGQTAFYVISATAQECSIEFWGGQ